MKWLNLSILQPFKQQLKQNTFVNQRNLPIFAQILEKLILSGGY